FAHHADQAAVDRRLHLACNATERYAVDERRGLRAHRCGTADFAEQPIEAATIAEIDTGSGTPFRLKDIARQRNLAVARLRRRADPALRASRDFADGHAWIGGGRNERRICPILQ